MNWPIGPARCRSDEREAEIGIVDESGVYGRIRQKGASFWNACRWDLNGSCLTYRYDFYDLLPPRLTLEEAARECEGIRVVAFDSAHLRDDDAMLAALQHYEKMKAEGRV